MDKKGEWAGLRTIAQVYSRVVDKTTGQVRDQQRYYISSLPADATLIGRAVRQHWSIKNSLHWTLDVVFREDYSTKRAGNAAINFALVNRLALSLLKNEKSMKASVRRKRMMAGWNNQYLQTFFQN